MIYLLNNEEKIVAQIRDVMEDVHREVLNGESTYIFKVSASEPVEIGQYVVIQDADGDYQMFEVTEVDFTKDQDEIKEVYCENISAELNDSVIDEERKGDTVEGWISTILNGTRWEFGTTDISTSESFVFIDVTVKQALSRYLKRTGAEIKYRVEFDEVGVTGRYVDILAFRGEYRGRRIRYGKDVESITRIVDTRDLKTALKGRGKGEELDEGHGRRITFASVNGGLDYVANEEAREQFGRLKDGERLHRWGYYESSEQDDPEKLLEETLKELERVSKPKVSYDTKFVDLETLPGYEHEKIRLGDPVLVEDDDFGRLSARAVEIERSYSDPEHGNIVLGDYIEDITDDMRVDELVRAFNEKSGIWEKFDKYEGEIPSTWLDGKIDALQNQLFAGGSFDQAEVLEDQGILFENNNIESIDYGAVYIGPSIIAIANSRDGDKWDFRTFGTGSGFTADELVAGTLKGGQVFFDLEEGTFDIGPQGNRSLSWDGDTLSIKGNIQMQGGSISWNNVNSDPSVDTKIDNAIDPLETDISNIESTMLTEDTLKTVNVLAENLKVGAANIEGQLTIGKISGLQSELDDKTTESQVTTITEDTIETTNVLAENLKVKSANIEGTITADAIKANTTISSPTIMGGLISTDDAGVTDAGSLSSAIRFWAGSSYVNRSNAKFRVTKGGELYARNAVIGGSGSETVGIGDGVVSSGDQAIAIGWDAQATGNLGIAIGWEALAEDGGSLAVGGKSKAKEAGVCFGLDSRAEIVSAVLGSNSTATGVESVAVGRFCSALGSDSVAIGRDTTASGSGAIAIGRDISASQNEIVLGGSNHEVIIPGSVSVSGDKSFVIPHPVPEKKDTHKLRHNSVESPTRGETMYRYKITADSSGEHEIELPEYFKHLNENPDVWVAGVKHFGRGYGEVEGNKLKVTVETAGDYKVLVIATRKGGEYRYEKENGENWQGEAIQVFVDEIITETEV